MPSERTCPKCGTVLSLDTMQGLCPKCVGRAAFDDPAGLPPLSAELEERFARLKPEECGEQIGQYQLLEQIGVGGFGTVWMAEQKEPVQRRVALKIVKLGMDTQEVIARFEQERQALAMMDHPNIARVLDAGATQWGRPYFVMELVRGLQITQFCDQRKLGTRERLLLFGDVCSAINHAHQKGIIHRDIKPSNVMVTLQGDKAVVKVIDFGIAKATLGKLTDKTLFTRLEQFIGTPVYMSPEQAAHDGLDIDTRSDIYALGILLYELLTGAPPFDAKSLASAGYEEMRRIIREVEPPKPSSRLSSLLVDERTTLAKARQIEPGKVSQLVEPDLDWVVMKAIEKDRSRRYETANGLALDIQRFLADEPVSATPPTAGYKFRKFARRNKTALSVLAGFLTLLIAGTVVSSWQAMRATKAEGEARGNLGKVAAERDQKEVARQDAEGARADAEAIATFLQEVFLSPDPSRDSRSITVAESLDKAAKKLETDLASQPRRQAMLRGSLGSTYLALGLHREAISLQETVRDYFLRTAGLEHPDTLAAMTNLALSYEAANRKSEALKLREDVLATSQKMFGPEHLGTLLAMNNLAMSYNADNRHDEALKLQEEVLRLTRKVLGPDDPKTLFAMNNLATTYHLIRREDEALKLREEVLALTRKSEGPEHPSTLLAINNLATSYVAAARREEALKLREELLPLCRKVFGPEHPHTIAAMGVLADSYTATDRKADALTLREQVLPLSRKVLGPEHPETLGAMYALSLHYFHINRRDEALKMREELLPLSRKVLGPSDFHTYQSMQALADSYEANGQIDKAKALRAEAEAIKKSAQGK